MKEDKARREPRRISRYLFSGRPEQLAPAIALTVQAFVPRRRNPKRMAEDMNGIGRRLYPCDGIAAVAHPASTLRGNGPSIDVVISPKELF